MNPLLLLLVGAELALLGWLMNVTVNYFRWEREVLEDLARHRRTRLADDQARAQLPKLEQLAAHLEVDREGP